MSMPYSTDTRPDTGLYNGKLGLWLFLAAETMFFGALFSSYAFLRTASETWPKGAEILPLIPALAAVLTGALAAAASARAWSTVQQSAQASMRWLWLAVIANLGTAALIILGLRLEMAEGMTPATNTFYACWYLIAGLVALHAAGIGAYALALLWPRSTPNNESALARQNRLECLGLFLQFVALVWLATFACFYVV